MELTKDLTSERLLFADELQLLRTISRELGDSDTVQDNEVKGNSHLYECVEDQLRKRIMSGDRNIVFSLGLLYMEQGKNKKAFRCFEESKDWDFQSLYQYSVMLYDGIGVEPHMWKALESMITLANSNSRDARHLLAAARFNIGRAYYQGYGIPSMKEDEAIKWWLMAADDGNPKGSVKAQSVLGMYYSSRNSLDLKKAFFWHSEACGNGSLESQGALGVMYMQGLGVKKDLTAAYICLKNAAERGNLYAAANLVAVFYNCKMISKCVELALSVSQVTDIEEVARRTDCLVTYVAKGVSLACFYLGRLIQKGLGPPCDISPVSSPSSGKSSKNSTKLAQTLDRARVKQLYSKSYRLDPDMCAKLYNMILHGTL